MRHKWKQIQQGPEGLFNYGKRTCENCGVTQTKTPTQLWGRVTGYRWFPLAGRCKKNN